MASKAGKMLIIMVLLIPIILAFGSYGLYSWSLSLDGNMGYLLFYSPLTEIHSWNENRGLNNFVETGRKDFDSFKHLTFLMAELEKEESTPAELTDQPTEKPEEPRPPEPSKPLYKGDSLDILVIGDSLANSVGKKLEPLINDFPDMTCRVEGVISSNLIRLDYYDWLTEGPRFAEEYAPDCILIFLGANTMQSFYLDGTHAPLFSETWLKIYKERGEKLLEGLKEQSADVYWMVLPPMQKESYNKNITFLNGVIDQICRTEEVKRFSYNNLLTDDEGAYISEKVVGDRQILIRSDGIHFTLDGASYISSYLIKALRERYEMPDPPVEESPLPESEQLTLRETQR